MAHHTLWMACGHQQSIKASVPAEHLEHFLAEMSSMQCDRCSSSRSTGLPSRDGRRFAGPGDGKPYNCTWCGMSNVTGPCRPMRGHDLTPASKTGIKMCLAFYAAAAIYLLWQGDGQQPDGK